MKETLIGKKITIAESNNKSLEGVRGKVVDETKNTITIIDEKNKEKKIIKNQVKIEVNGTIIDGKKITKRIEERIKK